MKLFPKVFFFSLLSLFALVAPTKGFSQILVYTSDTTGVLNSVATNATGTNLNRINGAVVPAAICAEGFSTTNFTSVTSYSSTLPAVEATATANAGYMLNVTGFSVDIRRSGTGPNDVMFAYSTDGGATWIDQGTVQNPNNASCGTTITATWTTSFTVPASTTLLFAVFGYDASSGSGTFQIMNLYINGTVTPSSTSSCPIPTGLTATGITSTSATVSWSAVTGAASYKLQYRPTGTTPWTSTGTTSTSVVLTGLTPATTYDYEVQTICTSSDSSGYTGITNFTTLSTGTSGGGSGSTGKMLIYFNYPVNTSVSTGVNAVYLNNSFADTIVAYINRAKYSVDIAQYDYNQSTGFASIASAVNNAYVAGKKVRWIYDGSSPNTGIALLNPGIYTLGSPTTSAYGIMHNKFVLIDANSSNAGDAIVNTGSEDWSVTQLNQDYNNMLFIQDSALAHVYLAEFNMMWGDTGVAPNTSLSKFGPHKTDLGRHLFTIGGKPVELYFSPSDNTDSHVQSTINSANTDLYFGVYDFTLTTDASDIVARQTAGVYVRGIVDQYSNTSSAYPILTSGLGANMITYTNASLIYHNKMMIVDPSNTCSDPQVLTGSYNWTNSANNYNDENILIIHNDTVANIYYQSFNENFTSLGGSISAVTGCPTSVNNITAATADFMVYPNPTDGSVTVSYNNELSQNVSLSVFNILGACVATIVTNELQSAGVHDYTLELNVPGMYYIRLVAGSNIYTQKVVKQ